MVSREMLASKIVRHGLEVLAIAVPSAAVTYFYSIWAQRLSGLADEIAVAVNAAHLGLLVELAWP
jgi:hypothetical protein